MANEKRLISLDDAIKATHSEIYWTESQQAAVRSFLVKQPKVDAVEVVHGRWEFGELEIMGQPVHCSICGWGADMVNKAMWLEYPGHKYCGNCGAKMDGDGNG